MTKSGPIVLLYLVKGYTQGQIYILASMGCSPGAPRLEGPPSSKICCFIIDGGGDIHNE